MNEEKINEHKETLLKVVNGLTNQENAERELYNSVTKALEEYLPRFVPDRENVVKMAGESAISNFRAGIEWYKNITPTIIDK